MNYQDVMSFVCPTKIYLGINSHRKLSEIINKLNIKRILFLCDPNIISAEIYMCIEKLLKDNGTAFDVFTDIEPEPSVKTLEKALTIYKAGKADTLLALGGGSTMDLGKAVGILATNGGSINDYAGNDKFSKPPVRLIAIPTTAGTGSEVSGSCVINDTDRKVRVSVRSETLNRSKFAILDPIALKSLPGKVAAYAAVDAFVHAFESYICLMANPVTDAVNLHAIELITHNVRPFVSNRNNLEAGLKMLCGASLASVGFTSTGLGNIHCMGKLLGSYFHVSHGLSSAVLLPYVAEFNLLAAPDRFTRVALAMGERIQGLTAIEAARRAVDAMWQLNRDLGIPERLRDVGVEKEKLPEMARLSFAADYSRLNPRYTTADDYLSIFEKAF